MTPKEPLVVPAGIVAELRTGLYAQIGMTAEELDSLIAKPDREHHPERYRKPLHDLDRVRSLLEEIGWSQSDSPAGVELDLAEHRRALLAALEMMLEAVEDLGPSDASDSAGSAPSRGEAARQRADAVRTFLHSVHAQVRQVTQPETEQSKGDTP